MALVREFERKEIMRPTKHQPTEASVASFSVDGEQFVQIDTYGKSTRQIPGKVSQSIQLDEESALKLIAILQEQFSPAGDL